MSWVLPVGLDFADGVTTLPVQPSGAVGIPTVVGTPLPTADISIYSDAGNVITAQEQPGSPKVERAEQATCEHTIELSWTDCIGYLSVMPRGTIVNDSGANIWRILSSDIVRLDGTRGQLHYVMESISFDSPPDDFELNDVSLDLNIIKHPRYAWAINPYISDNLAYSQVPGTSPSDVKIYYVAIKESIIRAIQSYTDSPFYPNADQVNSLIQNNIVSQINPTRGDSSVGVINVSYPNSGWNPNQDTVPPVPWDGTVANRPVVNAQYFVVGVPYHLNNVSDPITIAIAAARELISKLWREEDTPYIAGYEVSWTQYLFQPIYLNPGGYVEDPRDWVPEYFMNPNFFSNTIPRGLQGADGPVGPPSGGNSDTIPAGGSSGDSIFDFMTRINPQCFATNGLYNGPLALSSLRKSDKYGYQRTWFPITHTWLVAPIGRWDENLYNRNDRPQVSTDYNNLPNSFGT